MAGLLDISLEIDNPGYFVRDFFDDIEELAEGETFLDRVNASFETNAEAIAWLNSHYRGADDDGMGVTVNFLSFGLWGEIVR